MIEQPMPRILFHSPDRGKPLLIEDWDRPLLPSLGEVVLLTHEQVEALELPSPAWVVFGIAHPFLGEAPVGIYVEEVDAERRRTAAHEPRPGPQLYVPGR